MAWPSRDHRDYRRPAAPPAEPAPEPEGPTGPPVTERFVVSVSRFNAKTIQEGIERAAALYGLRCWASVGDDGRLRRDLKVTVHGSPQGVRDLMTSIGALREGTGGSPGPMG